jgi:CheY-like chemotaxis protein
MTNSDQLDVLIVDDSTVDRYSLASLLNGFGHQVDQCAESIFALEVLIAKQYDMVFLDVVMPEIDGYKLLRNIRLNPATSNQYVVLCSIKKTPLEINYGLERAGANDYLPKPATRESLIQILQRIPAQKT